MMSKLVKKAKITDYYSFLNVSSNENVQYGYLKKLQHKRSNRNLLKGITSVALTDHAVNRWNQRVGPEANKAELQNLFIQLLSVPGAIQLSSDDQGLIDEDILFIYEVEEGCLCITTFYGRLSLKPPLSNLNLLRRFNHCEQDSYNLDVSKALLVKQSFPIIPNECVRYKRGNSLYQIDQYFLNNQNVIFLYKISAQDRSFMTINLNNPKQCYLNKADLYILYKMGYKTFVINYYMAHNPNALIDAMIKPLLQTWVQKPISFPFTYSLIAHPKPELTPSTMPQLEAMAS